MRRALIVGINDYITSPLQGCVNDANKMKTILATNEDESPNFDCYLLTSDTDNITKWTLKQKINELFEHEADVALLYFSGHGSLEVKGLGGHLISQEEDGISMAEVLAIANNAKRKIKEIVIILDCCHSGAMGTNILNDSDHSSLREGLSILTASRTSEYAMETGGAGVFTTLIHDALNGGASDALGNVTAASIYGYADQALGAWDQRPLFKSHVSKLLPLRKCKPKASIETIRLLKRYFPNPYEHFQLDPSFEPTEKHGNKQNEQTFSNLQHLRAAGLIEPIDEEHMYYAALKSKQCVLTPLGRFYWTLVSEGRL
ncbi:caspase family protein [Priestia aryabhattai]